LGFFGVVIAFLTVHTFKLFQVLLLETSQPISITPPYWRTCATHKPSSLTRTFSHLVNEFVLVSSKSVPKPDWAIYKTMKMRKTSRIKNGKNIKTAALTAALPPPSFSKQNFKAQKRFRYAQIDWEKAA
jgi:hypothetical protein